MKTKKFQRHKEDFTCEHCGVQVKGTGYTNHCPECFYCKHVDINPGDRAASCQGLMEPIRLEPKDIIVHRCQRCGFERKNKLSPKDNREKLAQLIEELAKK